HRVLPEPDDARQLDGQGGGQDPRGRDRADEIELVADELITNALMHTEGSAIVTLRALTGSEVRLRVEVEDSSSALPRRREAGDSGVSGRGLLLVDLLTDVWGVEARGGGKAVWCEFVVPDPG
ncbi:ATP-binding protein, partial [Streptomyces sp. NPDC006129]|uniref:ATP-binding protein n=1 Tax=Streptomyces sp. NPDC006129 TaxID=3155348 RepID=UPI0033BA8C5F